VCGGGGTFCCVVCPCPSRCCGVPAPCLYFGGWTCAAPPSPPRARPYPYPSPSPAPCHRPDPCCPTRSSRPRNCCLASQLVSCLHPLVTCFLPDFANFDQTLFRLGSVLKQICEERGPHCMCTGGCWRLPCEQKPHPTPPPPLLPTSPAHPTPPVAPFPAKLLVTWGVGASWRAPPPAA